LLVVMLGVDPRLISRKRVARKSTKKTAISEPKTVCVVESLVVVVLVNMFVMNTGLGVDVVVSVVVLVSVRSE
jgi:hypothetical protein